MLNEVDPMLITSAASNGAGASFGSLAEGISGGWEGSDNQHVIFVIIFQPNEFYHGTAHIDSYI